MTRKGLFILVILQIIAFGCYAQGEAWNWYFGEQAALNFSSGQPVSLSGSNLTMRDGTSTSISDKAGTLQFYTNSEYVLNRNHDVMTNGNGLYGNAGASQPSIAFEAPGLPGYYYLFTVGDINHPGCYYSLINMGIGNGMVIQSNFMLEGSDLSHDVLMATKHANKKAYWVVIRSLDRPFNKLLAYLVDSTGVNAPKVSTCLGSHGPEQTDSKAKFSPDGNYYVYSRDTTDRESPHIYELYRFNEASGLFTPLFSFAKDWEIPEPKPPVILEYCVKGIEFSANSQYLYTSVQGRDGNTPKQAIIRYNLLDATDSETFEDRADILEMQGSALDKLCSMQLGPDGKIYIANYDKDGKLFLSEISSPAASGNPGFVENSTPLFPNKSSKGLPLFVPSYLAHFDWKGSCVGDSTFFQHRFLPKPSSILWDFGDPDSGPENTSNKYNPAHLFSKKGEFLVTATAYYGGEATAAEVFKRKVFISDTISLTLPTNYSVCPGTTEVTISVGGGIIPFPIIWSNDSVTSSIKVTPPGTWWVKGENNYGCTDRDTIEITMYSAPAVNESALQIIPATCGTHGSITGLSVNGATPITYTWKDATGNIITSGNNSELLDQNNGTYALWISDGNGCTFYIKDYTIDNDGDYFIDNVSKVNSKCGAKDGEIHITAVASTFAMEYQIEVSGSWYSTGDFFNLEPNVYYPKVRIKENPGCISDYEAVTGVTTVIDDEGAPTILDISSEPALDSNPDGEVTIVAQGMDPLTYYLNLPDGRPPQGSGLFDNVPAGTWNGYVEDVNGCKKAISVTVDMIVTVVVTAEAGADEACVGYDVTVPVQLSGLEGVEMFSVVLTYDNSMLTYLNKSQVDPLLASNFSFSAGTAGEITMAWNGPPITFNGLIDVLELTFKTTQPGLCDLNWKVSASNFTGNILMNIVPEYYPGQVVINNQPALSFPQPLYGACEGSQINIRPVLSPPGSYTMIWTLPNGSTQGGNNLIIPAVNTNSIGNYDLKVIDQSGCADSSFTSVMVYTLPDAGLPEGPQYFEDEIQLVANPGYASYLWNTGETTSSVIVNTPGIYTVDITTNMGCYGSFSTEVLPLIEMPFYFYMPNAFSPDGYFNKTFGPATVPQLLLEFRLQIFAGNGQMVFESKEIDNSSWDGKIKGQEAETGLYFWKTFYRNKLLETKFDSGVVVLIR